jgi:microcystin-dependent protein
MVTIKTGDTLSAGITCFLLTMPPDDWFKQAILSVLLESAQFSSWKQFGTIDITDAVERANEMLESMLIFPFNPLPVGRVESYAGSVVPEGWLLCDGSLVNTADFPELFSAIAYTWGGSGATFNLPDLIDRTIVGTGGTYALADSGGEAAHTLTTSELSSHDHIASGGSATDLGHAHTESAAVPAVATLAPGVPFPYALPGASITGVGNANITVVNPSISSTGGDSPHNNMQPFAALNMIIFAGR